MRLMDRILEPTKDYINFSDLLYGLSAAYNEPLYDVAWFLDCKEFDMLKVFSVGSRYEMIPNMESQETIYFFLKSVMAAIPMDWVFKDTNSLDELAIEEKQEVLRLFNGGAFTYFYKSDLLSFPPLEGYLSFLDSETVGEEATRPQGNHSLASYMAEYTLPQVVALILHIDLADITTTPNNSYIHNQNDYAESVYHKFANLLQSYSVAALNNKLAGVDLHTRTVTPYLGDTETHVDLEKTSISRGDLAKYLDSIGYQMNDLIAKQEPVHTQYPPDDSLPYCFEQKDSEHEDSEHVLSLQQQIAVLRDQVGEKDKELKANGIKLDLALKKIKEASEPIGNGEQLTDNTANDYQVTIGVLLELLRTPKGCDKEGKPNRPLFLTQNDIVTAITDQLIPNHGKTKVSERFTASNYALSEVKKKRDSDLEEKLALAERIKKNPLLSS